MTKETMEIRHNQWKNIIEQCDSRPFGQTAKQWLTEHDIPIRTYYRWQVRLRQEVRDQVKEAKPPSTDQDAGVTFVTIPQSSDVKIEEQLSFHADAIIQTSQCTIAVSNSTSEQLLKEILEATSYVSCCRSGVQCSPSLPPA